MTGTLVNSLITPFPASSITVTFCLGPLILRCGNAHTDITFGAGHGPMVVGVPVLEVEELGVLHGVRLTVGVLDGLVRSVSRLVPA